MTRKFPIVATLSLILTQWIFAEVELPKLFSDHMVLQRNQENPIWGSANANESLSLSFAEKTISVQAGSDGKWRATLPALPAGGPYTLRVEGSSTVELQDILIGEVWICSGQSNMEWPLQQTYGAEVEIAAANFPNIRLLSVPRKGSSIPQDDVGEKWQVCSPETVSDFSAVGYHFGQKLHSSLQVPIGLIDNAWGGSRAEAWVPKEVLHADENYQELLSHWQQRIESFDATAHEAYLAEYEAWVEGGFQGPSMDWDKTVHPIHGQHRPANIYNGMLHPIIGYGIRGVIWYQGESNANRAKQYLDLFPLMVKTWRNEWKQGDFPFYWVQLADFGEEVEKPADNDWAELRDAQTLSMDILPNSGQAVIIDIGEGRDIHPRDKHTVASRLVRWPLAQDYDFDISYQSPRYKSMTVEGNKVQITLDHVSDQGLWSFDNHEIQGFSIAGPDKNFVWAQAKIVDSQTIEVWSEGIADPVAVRYGWAANPRVNLYDRNGLPVTPFRTDDWPWLTAGVGK